MVSSWRAIVTAMVTAVAATVALAVVVEAAPAPRSDITSIVTTHPARVVAKAAVASLPPVTEHALDPQLVAALQQRADRPAGQTVTEVIQLTVIGGDLELVSDHVTVTLMRVPGSDRDWTGALPPVRVIDARGTHEGWTVGWTVASLDLQGTGEPGHLPDAKVQLEPGAPLVVAGTPDGLAAGKPGSAVQKGRTLFSAAPGSGGGTYEAGGTLSLRLPEPVDVDSVVVELSFSLG